MLDNEDVIFAEVFYNFTPIVNFAILDNTQVYKVAVSKPRLGALDTLN